MSEEQEKYGMPADRRTYLGGSALPVILGVKTPGGKTLRELWEYYTGATDSAAETGIMRRGRDLAPYAITEYQAHTGRECYGAETFLLHPERPYLGGHFDSMIRSPEGILEVKIPNVTTWYKYRRQGLADYIQIQGQTYLAVSGKELISYWIWSPETYEGIQVDMPRDEQIINLIYEKAAEFWHYVETRTPPKEAEIIPLELPKVGGSLVSMEGVEPWEKAAKDLRMAHELKEESERIYEDAKARVVALMGTAGAAEGAGVRVYNQIQKGRISFDKGAALADLFRSRVLLETMRNHLPVDFMERCPAIIEEVDRLINKASTEKDYQKQGAPFRSFRPYFLKSNLLEE